ncbi:hypothetical protein [Chitinophaga sp.]|uniref:ECF transporter S component n=1 Tax=Chitinophaga sp. TaxID=1869181 RepID=UPI0031D50B0A
MDKANRHTNLSPVYGITIAVISIVFTIIFYVTQVSGMIWTGYFGSLVLFLGVLFSVIHYNSQHHERANMMAMFSMGFRTTLWAVVITTLFSVVFHFMEADQTETNFWIYLFGNVFFTNIIVGIIASIIAAMVFKRNQKTTKSD